MKVLLKQFQLFVFCSFSLLSFNTNAYQPAQHGLDFSLSVQRQSSKIELPSGTHNVSTNQLGIRWHEPFNDYFNAGLEVGYNEMTQVSNPVSSAQFTSGEYVGILLRFKPLQTNQLELELDLNYRYNQSRGSSINQQTQFTWDESIFSARLHYWPAKTVGLFVGADYFAVTGTQRDSGTVSQVQTFSENEQQGFSFGLQFIPYSGGIVGIESHSGYRSGGKIYFQRSF